MKIHLEQQEPGRLFELRSKDVEIGEWGLVLVPPEATPGDEIQPEDVIPIGLARDQGEDLFVYGAMIALLRRGQNVGAMFNPSENISLEPLHES